MPSIIPGRRGGILAAVIDGSLARILDEERDALAVEFRTKVNRAGLGLRDALRGQVRAVFRPTPRVVRRLFGQNLEKTIRSRTYPERTTARTLGPATLVYSTFRHLNSHIEGVTIRALGGTWLAIPTQEAEARGWVRAEEARDSAGRFARGSRAKRSRIDLALRALGSAGAQIRYAPIAGGRMVLMGIEASVGRDLGYRDRYRTRAGGTKRRRFIPLFILVKQVTLRPRFDPSPAAEKAQAALLANLARPESR